ncbi:hypothetical protein SAMN05216215_104742 [Saccharopolyspora shandongensis]|uniref:Head-to-tail stopper n=1 Tax=Saccharopolyspora shandongensis TaxID=418495 RepID=A0A1H3QFJ3_9PSEU|nr:hypothetical protein [Saccharopolyspora shandongensis]SDZ12053.1 hypothetical protein SAMN05216215_104742 [Saccharopolyspora shandongensis]
MSLLDKYNAVVTVHPEETWEDEDGNIMTRPSPVGIETPAMVQLAAQSGTSSRNAENFDMGYNTEEIYRLRLPKDFQELGPSSVIEWEGRRHNIFGRPQRFQGSKRTTRIEYLMRRN